MVYGYNSKMLRVDLSQRKTWVEDIDDIIYKLYFGGTTLISYYLLKEQRKTRSCICCSLVAFNSLTPSAFL